MTRLKFCTSLLHTSNSHYQIPLLNPSVEHNTHNMSKKYRCYFDNCNEMKEHITSVCRASHFHLRNIGLIRCNLTPETCATLVHSPISSKLDYCNSLLIELLVTQINRLLHIQNSATRIVSRRPGRCHINTSP